MSKTDDLPESEAAKTISKKGSKKQAKVAVKAAKKADKYKFKVEKSLFSNEDKNGEVTKQNKIIEELEQRMQDQTDQNQRHEMEKLEHETEKLKHEMEKLKQITCQSKQETNNIITPVVVFNQNYGPSSGESTFNVR